jgi:iron(III) transport system substrate-binding protein
MITRLLILTLFYSLSMPLAAQDRTPLYVLSATDESAVRSLIKRYEQHNPAVRIEYHDYNTNELFDLVMQEHDKPDFRADVIISSAMDLQVKLVNEGLAHRFEPTNQGEIPDWAQWRKELFGFTFEPAVIAYNKAAFSKQEIPATHAELTAWIKAHQQTLSGKIGTYDINLSGVGYLFATQDAVQNSQIIGLVQNMGQSKTQVFCCTYKILDRIASGELLLGYNVLGSYALATAAKDPRIGIHFPADYTLVMARTAFVYRDSPQKEYAADFIDFLLSDAGQSAIAEDSALIPIKTNINSLLTPYSNQSSFIYIKLGTGLLAYLDQLKKKYFLQNWTASMQ